jgi:tRNA A-37 threonylcarbamoyl transferase component Bud32
MKLVIETQLGTIRGECDSEPHLRAAVGPVLGAVFEPGKAMHEVTLGNTRAWFKGSHLRGKARLRHTLRSKLLFRPAPRVRELKNLEWLRARMFQAPKPLAAGVLERHGFPTYQFLFTETVPGAKPFEEVLRAAPQSERAALFDELARETARLHALHFAHRDLFVRNLLAVDAGAARRLWFIDCWRGGPERARRDAAYDLGSFMLEGASLFSADEQKAFFERYFAERQAQGASAERKKLLAGAAAHRKKWLARIAKDPGRWRSPEPPLENWDWKALLA